MEENFKNRLGFWTFLFIVVFLAVGGYFFTDYVLTVETTGKNVDFFEEVITDYKIDKNKDYIFFENEKSIIDTDDADVYYKDVIINIKGQESVTEVLKNENRIYQNNIKYLSDMNFLNNELVTYNYNNIYALTFREYKIYKYNNYISLVIDDHNYSCFDLNTFIGTKSYIFDIKTGQLITNEEILDRYNLNINNVSDKVRENLVNNQKIVDEVELIKIDDTINNLNYSLYINEYGRLYISFLVKTTQVDYNEVMEV